MPAVVILLSSVIALTPRRESAVVHAVQREAIGFLKFSTKWARVSLSQGPFDELVNMVEKERRSADDMAALAPVLECGHVATNSIQIISARLCRPGTTVDIDSY